ncbi:MAG: hypothetical protein RL670_108 [Actinomycetota bacterium]
MRRILIALVSLGLATTLAACGYSDNGSNPDSSLPTIDPSLIPTAPPAGTKDVAADQFKTSYGDYIFKVGLGPAWCSVNVQSQFALCEQSEVTAQYQPIPVPSTCDFSYGYQVRLWANKPDSGDFADFPCAGGAYADPSSAKVLNTGERVQLGAFSCWVDNVTARCENPDKKYIVLGPQAWALGNN